jgi:raffinose/stachyose/melibiose transport system substrate-binding protein
VSTPKHKKAYASLAIAAALLLSACGSSGEAPSSTEASAESGGGSSTEQVTVDFWSWNPDEPTAKPYIELFEAGHPNIKINHRYVQYSDYPNTVQMALQSDSGPDVFGLQVGALTTQFEPLVEDLTPAIQAALGDDWQTKLSATDQLAVNGKQVGLPWMVTVAGLIWANQTLVDSLNLTVPTNMAELKAFCTAVKAAGKDCIMQGAKDSWQNVDVFQAILNQVSPGLYYKADAGEASYDSEEFVKAFEIWKSFFDEGFFQEGALGMTAYPEADDAFKKGQGALIVFGSWSNNYTTHTGLAQFAESLGDEFDTNTMFMPYFFPQVVDGAATGTMFGGPDVGFAVSANTDVKEAAETFATWLVGSEEAQKLQAKTLQQPALASVPLDDSDVVTPEQVSALEQQGPALANMIGAREMSNADVRTALGDALSAVASGQQTPAEAAAAVQAVAASAG